ncbi:MAG: hypothetical protein CMP23_02800 [Rickettsiales bacterium]|nr:hypothetical protein [Rickettsiales bacterium]
MLSLLLLGLSLSACSPDCRGACEHMLLECGVERAAYTVEDCTTQCEQYLAHYADDRQRAESRTAVACVKNADCAALREGTPCYDEEVYVW